MVHNGIEFGTPLDQDSLQQIRNSGERLFAQVCMAKNLTVFHDIRVGKSRIDFAVFNEERMDAPKLVEVTYMSKDALSKRSRKVRHNGRTRTIPNHTGGRKERQISNMKDSGLRWTILFRENLHNIEQHFDDITPRA